ncbi:hypothetical protein C492_18820 [Natronococcus jeotgali DSM 18795]|uniref:Uncharacterized protein n=1 Tax=Natronococcus jeotgali DSM 18795 TaxID=1227498 RepID=L9WTT6_9EURY|nr:hypothetical protein C492_18820 [Natronococcus jeotgali DSM 18795]
MKRSETTVVRIPSRERDVAREREAFAHSRHARSRAERGDVSPTREGELETGAGAIAVAASRHSRRVSSAGPSDDETDGLASVSRASATDRRGSVRGSAT